MNYLAALAKSLPARAAGDNGADKKQQGDSIANTTAATAAVAPAPIIGYSIVPKNDATRKSRAVLRQQPRKPGESEVEESFPGATGAGGGGGGGGVDGSSLESEDKLRGREKRHRERDDVHCDMIKNDKYYWEKYKSGTISKRNGSCTRKHDHGNSQSSSYCCREYYANALHHRVEAKKTALDAKKGLDSRVKPT